MLQAANPLEEYRAKIRRANEELIRWLEAKSPEQRHFVAHYLNWDFAEPVIDWLVTRPDCDLATAVDLFWLGSPDYFLEFPSRATLLERTQIHTWNFDFLAGVAERASQGFFARNVISFYADAGEYEALEDKYRAQGLPWTIPDSFRKPFHGIDVPQNDVQSEYWSDELGPLLKALGTMVNA